MKVAVLAILAALHSICAEASEDAARAVIAADPYIQCIGKLADDPAFGDIVAKLPLRDISAISFSMLADESLPTEKERKEINDWFDRREDCIKAGDAIHRAQWPPEIYQLAVEGSSGAQDIGVNLYNRKISFGEANRQLQQLGNATKAKMIPIIKQYQAEIAAQKTAQNRYASEQRQQFENQARAQEAADQSARLQRAQLFLDYMRAQQSQQFHAAPLRPTYTTNCHSSGSNTNCTTY